MQENELRVEWTRLGAEADYESLRRFLYFLSPSVSDLLFLYDVVRDSLILSPKAVDRFRVPGSEFADVKNELKGFVHPDDLPAVLNVLNQMDTSGKIAYNRLCRILTRDGNAVWMSVQGSLARDEQGRPLFIAGAFCEAVSSRSPGQSTPMDLSELRRMLIGKVLPPEGGFFMRINVDDFSILSARIGAERSDEVIAVLTDQLLEALRPTQRMFRLMGDEFMVADLKGGTLDDAQSLYNELRLRLSRVQRQDEFRLPMTVSAGVVSCADMEDLSLATVMSLTGFAVAHAKRDGKNRCYLYDSIDFERFDKNRTLHSLLVSSVEHNFEGFEVYYQLLYSSGRKRITGAEALLRYHTREFGTVSPMEIIPILEEHGLIIPVGLWVLRQACEACVSFQEQVPDFRMSVNVSPVQVQRSPFWQDLNRIIQETGVDPSCVVCEITESEKLENDSHLINLSRWLRKSNILLALDDFGTGYSNFRYLPDLMPNLIKIDRMFTAKAARDPYEFKLLSMFSEMAHTLGIEIVVEGVENDEELETARLVSADYIQGYYYGRPAPFDQVLRRLNRAAQDGHGSAVAFPALLLDRHFVASVTTGPYNSISWVNTHTGELKAYKRRGPIQFLAETLDELVNGIVERGLVHPDDVHDLRTATALETLQSVSQSESRKMSHKLRVRVHGAYEWVLMEMTAPNTYSDEFPFVLISWRRADRFFSLQEEALRMVNRDFYKVSIANLTLNTITELKDSEHGGWLNQLHSVPLDCGLTCVCDHGNVHPDDEAMYRRFMDVSHLSQRLLAGEKRLLFRFRRRIGDEFRWVQMEMLPAMDYSPENQQVMIFVRDIHEERMADLNHQQKLERLAITDPLTGLYNRHFYREMNERYDLYHIGRPAGFLYADLNNLKHINDTEGHGVGDRFIASFAAHLTECFPQGMCIRMSGDEFAVCAPSVAQDDWNAMVADLRGKIQSDTGDPIAAIGDVWLPASTAMEELMTEAEKRMYEDKKRHSAGGGGDPWLMGAGGRWAREQEKPGKA